MIWHIYDSNTEKAMEKMIIKEQQPQYFQQQQQQQRQQQQQQQYTSSISSSEDILMHTDDEEEGDYSAEDEGDIAMSSQKSVATVTSTSSKSTRKGSNKEQQISNSSQAPLFLNFTSDLCLHQPNSNKKKKNTIKNQTSYKVNGVNILNRKNLDSKTAIERIQKRRENHNHVERRRRDCINNTILELSHIIPNASLPGQKLNKGNVLKLALDHILYLQSENISIKNQLNQILESREPVQSSSNLIGNTPSYLLNNIRPTIRSPTLFHHNTSPIMYTNSSYHQYHTNTTATTIATATATATTSFRPLLPAINNNSNNSQHPYQASDYHSPDSSFIYNKSYYKNTCRYL